MSSRLTSVADGNVSRGINEVINSHAGCSGKVDYTGNVPVFNRNRLRLGVSPNTGFWVCRAVVRKSYIRPERRGPVHFVQPLDIPLQHVGGLYTCSFERNIIK